MDFDKQILVPFPVESALSGVMQKVRHVWYRRSFEIPANWHDKRVLLNFGAVDWEATVWVNGHELGTHQGGYDAFSIDVTDALKPAGPQQLVVRVYDPTSLRRSAAWQTGRQARRGPLHPIDRHLANRLDRTGLGPARRAFGSRARPRRIGVAHDRFRRWHQRSRTRSKRSSASTRAKSPARRERSARRSKSRFREANLGRPRPRFSMGSKSSSRAAARWSIGSKAILVCARSSWSKTAMATSRSR